MVSHFHHCNLLSVTILLLYLLPALSLAALITVAGFHAYSNEGGPLHIFRWGAGTGVLNLTSSSGLTTGSIIASPDKAAVFPYFYDMATFLASSVPYPSPDIFSLASSAAVFDNRGNKGGDEQ